MKRYFKIQLVLDSFKTIVFRVIGVSMLLGLTLFLPNNYPADIVGQYDFVRSFLLVIGSLALLGTDQSILYFAGRLKSAKLSDEIKYVYLKMVGIILLISLVILLLILLVDSENVNNYFKDDNVYNLLLKSVIILFFYCIGLLNIEVFRALNYLVISEIYRNILKYAPLVVGSVILLFFKIEQYLVDVFLLGFIFIAIISSLSLYKYLKKDYKKITTETISFKEVVLKSYPIAISSMAIFMLMSIDVMFLKKYKSNEVVAYYSVALKFIMILAMVINTININMSSKIAELFNSDKIVELNQMLKHGARLIFFLSLPLVLLIVIFPETILSFFGEKYIASKQALIIMTISQGICTSFGAVTVYLNMTGRQKIFQNVLLISVFINCLLNRLLIPKYGMTGAAIAFSASLFFWNFIACLLIYKKDKVKIFIR